MKHSKHLRLLLLQAGYSIKLPRGNLCGQVTEVKTAPVSPDSGIAQNDSVRSGQSADGLATADAASFASQLIFLDEGPCQNRKNDPSNWVDGVIGYTCLGLNPDLAWRWRSKYLSYCAECSASNTASSKASFPKCCYDKDASTYRRAAASLFQREIFKFAGCEGMSWPSFYGCAHTAVTDSLKAAKAAVAATGPCEGDECRNGIHCAMIVEHHRAAYHDMALSDKKFEPALEGISVWPLQKHAYL